MVVLLLLLFFSELSLLATKKKSELEEIFSVSSDFKTNFDGSGQRRLLLALTVSGSGNQVIKGEQVILS